LNYFSYHDYMLDSYKPEDMQVLAKASTQYLRPKLQKFHQELRLRTVFGEWNTMWGRPGTVGMGLYAAGVLNLLCREAEALGVERAYFSQPVSEGAIKVTPLTAELDTVGKVFAAFKVHQGNRSLKLPEMPADADLDVCASVQADGHRVCATIVNRSITKDHTLELLAKNMARPVKASARFLIARDVTQQQADFDEREKKPTVTEDSRPVVKVPRYSVAVIELTNGYE